MRGEDLSRGEPRCLESSVPLFAYSEVGFPIWDLVKLNGVGEVAYHWGGGVFSGEVAGGGVVERFVDEISELGWEREGWGGRGDGIWIEI
jgi:hypothetical protein